MTAAAAKGMKGHFAPPLRGANHPFIPLIAGAELDDSYLETG